MASNISNNQIAAPASPLPAQVDNNQAEINGRRVAPASKNNLLSRVVEKVKSTAAGAWSGIQKFGSLFFHDDEPKPAVRPLPAPQIAPQTVLEPQIMPQPVAPKAQVAPRSAPDLFFNHQSVPGVVAQIINFALQEHFWPNDPLMQVSKSFYQAAREYEADLFLARPATVTQILEEAHGDVRNIKPQHLKALQKVQDRISFVLPSGRYTLHAFFDAFPHLQSIDLSHTVINDEILKTIAERYPNLKSLRMSHQTFITEGALISLIEHCPHLESFDMLGYGGDATAAALGKHCPALQCASVGPLHDAGVVALAAGCRHLRSIVLRNSEITDVAITDVGIQELADHCHELESLDLYHNWSITNASMKALGAGCPHLKYLSLAWCLNITTRGICDLVIGGCHELESINLSATQINRVRIDEMFNFVRPNYFQSIKLSSLLRFSDELFDVLSSHCPNLHTITLSDCLGIINDYKSFDVLSSHCPNLHTITLSDCLGIIKKAFVEPEAIPDELITSYKWFALNWEGFFDNSRLNFTIKVLS